MAEKFRRRGKEMDGNGWTQWRIKMLNFVPKQNIETLSFGKKQGGKNIFSLTI